MIKVARKYSFDKYGKGRSTILTLNRSFHGRTITTLTATGQESYHNYFFPFNEAFRYADPTLESIQAQAGDDVCAVMVELIQGRAACAPWRSPWSSPWPPCAGRRTGCCWWTRSRPASAAPAACSPSSSSASSRMWSPSPKGIAGGLPMGGILTNEKCAGVLTPGTHGSTFGANPVSTAAGLAVLETMDQPFLDQVREKGAYLRAGIQAIGSPELGDVVGLGLMLGIDVKGPPTNKELAALLIDHGLLCLTAGDRLRLLPPLVITKEEMDEGLAILKQTLMG